MRPNLTPLQNAMYIHCKELPTVCWEMPFNNLLQNRKKVHIWITDLQNYSKQQFAILLGLLSKHELQKVKSFHYEEDRKRYIVAKATLRKLLSRYQLILPQSILFSRNAFHKPFLHPNPNSLQFNVAHSGSKVLLAFRFNARGTSIGIDMEKVNNDYDYKVLVKEYFTEEEQLSISDENSSELFYKLWTRKEALLKAFGTGLTDDMKQLNVSKYTNIVRMKNAHYSRVTQRPFYVNTFKIDDNYIASFALESAPVKPLFLDYDYFL